MRSAASLPENSAGGRRPSRLTAGATGGAVLAVCLAYAGWSLSAGRTEEAPHPEAGVALGDASTPTLAPVDRPEVSPPAARLALDEGIEFTPADVTNAHLEVAADAAPTGIEPTVQQLGFASGETTEKPVGAVGAWLTGGIEPVTPQSSFTH